MTEDVSKHMYKMSKGINNSLIESEGVNHERKFQRCEIWEMRVWGMKKKGKASQNEAQQTIKENLKKNQP